MNSRLRRTIESELPTLSEEARTHVAEYCEERGAAHIPAAMLELRNPRAKAILGDVFISTRDDETTCYEAVGVKRATGLGFEFMAVMVRIRNNRLKTVSTSAFGYGPIRGFTHGASAMGPKAHSVRSIKGIDFLFDRFARIFCGEGVGELRADGDEGDRWILPPRIEISTATHLLDPICYLIVEFAKESVLAMDGAEVEFGFHVTFNVVG